MKVSIITVCYNSEKTIKSAIDSVLNQDYPLIEHIIIDGQSNDRTNDIITKYKGKTAIHISEKDHGLYDAMNKGLKLATGDLIGTLNSDDVLANNQIISLVVNSLEDYDGVYADVGYYKDDLFRFKKRHYSSQGFKKSKFSRGIMPAHPSCYIKKECFDKAGFYNTRYKIASDFDMMLRIFSLPNKHFLYIEKEFVKMRLGGISTQGLASNYILNKEIIDSCRANGIQTSWVSILSKYPAKLLGLFINK